MYLVAIGWIYVVMMMAAAELASPSGTWLGALVTIVLYGVLPVSLLMYLMGTPMRARARRKREAAVDSSAGEPDAGGHPSGDAVAPVGKET
ncbi:hypothetical protein [Piscinibacter sakaiensis]|uniref:hypothetical protein n=1 Tax=Piscinibacter sakaiensis TaxID=1547922 RepID=UPI003AABD119